MTKPSLTPPKPFADARLHQQGDWLWIPLRHDWREISAKPEEVVRQNTIRLLVETYGYSLDQMDQERRVMAGTRSPRADIVVWETAAAMKANATPAVVIECKAEDVAINTRDYYQGESYARASACEFMVATNRQYMAMFKLVPGFPGGMVEINAIPGVRDWGDARRLDEIRNGQRGFDRREFQDLLFECHSMLRNAHKMDPGAAFDTMSKILFIKMGIERRGEHGVFTTEFIDGREKYRMVKTVPMHEELFDETKRMFATDALFTDADHLDISESTFRRIVKKLERFDLSKTGEDIKGLAFERFLGGTYRGDLGQYFTPRPVVEFMVDALDPHEGDLICDPAAGSGGFLIRAFEHVRGKIIADVQTAKDTARQTIAALGLSEDDEDARIEAAFADANRELVPSDQEGKPVDTRVGRLAWRCLFGADAEPRAARTAKMNMIMHGDGHGGIHYYDGLVDINGIFPGRFDVVLSNPPFGASVGRDQEVGTTEQTRVSTDPDYLKRCRERYGPVWNEGYERTRAAAAKRTPILDLFEIGRGKPSRPTEIVFVERCLELLRPGGRTAIVLPDSNLNNPSLDWLRRWCEGKAKLLGVVSLPEETFRSADASAKCSVVMLQRFTASDAAAWDTAWAAARTAVDPGFAVERDAACAAARSAVLTGDVPAAEAGLAALAEIGIVRTGPEWREGDAPAYPRGATPSRAVAPGWTGEAADPRAAAIHRRAYAAAVDGDASRGAARALAAALKAIDLRHTAALWTAVRVGFDYPVFVAAPQAVGITSTGETGEGVPNELPQVLAAWRGFAAWLAAGADPEEAPDFPLPLAA